MAAGSGEGFVEGGRGFASATRRPGRGRRSFTQERSTDALGFCRPIRRLSAGAWVNIHHEQTGRITYSIDTEFHPLRMSKDGPSCPLPVVAQGHLKWLRWVVEAVW